MIERMEFFGSHAIGIFAMATDAYCIVPGSTKQVALERLEVVLGVPCVPINVSFKKLMGVMFVGNSSSLLVPNHVSPRDEELIRDALATVGNIHVHVMVETKLNALGNLIACNDAGAIVSTKFPPDVLPVFEEHLGVKAVQATVGGSPLAGTKIVANSRGCLVSPLASEDQAGVFAEILAVEEHDYTTACLGMEAIRVGIIANSNGALVGRTTSGPEMSRISDVLGV